jgi:hypothetical protein
MGGREGIRFSVAAVEVIFEARGLYGAFREAIFLGLGKGNDFIEREGFVDGELALEHVAVPFDADGIDAIGGLGHAKAGLVG